jgi:predicted phage tail protein
MRRNIRYFIAVLAITISGVNPVFAIDSPNAPTGVAVDNATPANSTSLRGAVSVTWTKSVVDGTHPIPIAYTILATATGENDVLVTVPVTSPTTTSFTSVVESLTGGISYQFVVTARASNEQTAAAASVPYTPKSIPRDPTTVSAVAAPGSATLTWTAPSNKGGLELTKYVISDSATINIDVTNVALTSYTKTGLTAGQIYKFSITAYNSIGKSSSVNFADVTIPSAPGVPTSVSATAGTSNIAVSWIAPLSTGGSTITGYKVSLFNDAGSLVGAEQSTAVTNYDFTGVSAGTYTVKVKATNIVGDSAFSTASSSVTIAAPTAKLDRIDRT